MVALVFAPEHPGPADAQNISGAEAAGQDAVHVHRVVVYVLAVAKVFPMFAAIPGADDTAHLDGAK